MEQSLADFKVGTVVSAVRNFQVSFPGGMSLKGKTFEFKEWISDVEDFGHVVKFERNTTGEVILVVDWSSGDRTSIHPSNVSIV